MHPIKRLAKALKPVIPSVFWASWKGFYHRRRYARLWRDRQVVRFDHRGTSIVLVIVDPNDYIQAQQSKGTFYEETYLAALAPYFKPGGTFVDIGANTGQHSVYFAKVFGAGRLILVEPIRESYNIIEENLRLNGLDDISTKHFGIGLGASGGSINFASFLVDLDNLGATTLKGSDFGTIPLYSGDHILREQHVDFIKIDTEGFEIKVLSGLVETIKRCRPTIYIEVDNSSMEGFMAFLDQSSYRIELRHKHYVPNENFLILPKEQ